MAVGKPDGNGRDARATVTGFSRSFHASVKRWPQEGADGAKRFEHFAHLCGYQFGYRLSASVASARTVCRYRFGTSHPSLASTACMSCQTSFLAAGLRRR